MQLKAVSTIRNPKFIANSGELFNIDDAEGKRLLSIGAAVLPDERPTYATYAGSDDPGSEGDPPTSNPPPGKKEK